MQVFTRDNRERMKLRVWWIPQIPMDPFYVDVKSMEEGVKILDVLANYDTFQFENKIKPDYSNMGGLSKYHEIDEEWEDWYDEKTGQDLEDYLKSEELREE
jgi:hypothetical protein